MRIAGILYDTLVPGRIRRRLYDRHARAHLAQLRAARARAADAAASADLTDAYLAHLRIVPNREALLRGLARSAVAALVGVGDGELARRVLLVTTPRRLYLCEEAAPPGTSECPSLIRAKFAAELKSGQAVWVAPEPGLGGLPDGPLDWAFLDPAPGYASWWQQLELCRAVVRETGVIAGVGYGGDDVDGHGLDAVRAVNEFCKKHGWQMMLLTHESHRRLGFAIARM
jgi:hypothetical protein